MSSASGNLDRSDPGRLGRSTYFALAALALAVLVVTNDFTAFSVALPTMEHDLHTDLSTIQWVVNAYAVVFSVVIVTGGRLSDMLGRRKVFVVGAVIFATFSFVGGLSPDVRMLIACRGLMGIGGALMWPAVLGMTYDLLPEEKAGLAGGIILGCAGFGNALGPLLGGFLTTVASWRWILFINLPIAALALCATLITVKADPPRQSTERLDYAGVGTLSVGIVSLLVALDLSSSVGWGSPVVIALLVIAPVGLVAFSAVERHGGPNALLPSGVLANRTFVSSCVAIFLLSGVMFGTLVYLPQFMVRDLGWSAVRAGAGMLPMMITWGLLSSLFAGPLYSRFGAKAVATAGGACMSIGVFALIVVGKQVDYGWLVPGMVIVGVGAALMFSSISTAAITALDPSQASLAGGIVYMFNVAGGSILLAVNTAIVTAGVENSASLASGIAHAFLIDGVLGLIGTFVVFTRIGATPAQSPELRRAGPTHHRLLHRRQVA